MGRLQINERSVKRVSKELSLINERIRQEDVVGAPTTFSERPLKGVGYVFSDHKRHEAIIKGASKQFTQATGNRKGAVIGWVLLRSLLMKGGDLGLFTNGRETS